MFVLGKTWHPRDSKRLPDTKQIFGTQSVKKCQMSERIIFDLKGNAVSLSLVRQHIIDCGETVRDCKYNAGFWKGFEKMKC